MRRILVAVDGSRVSREAARLALEFAEHLGTQVTFLHVLPERVAGERGEAPEFAAFEHACEKYAAHMMEETRRTTGPAHLCSGSHVLHGDPVEAISEAAAAADVELVIVGTRDRGPLARALLGSVASELMRRCPKPVMVVPERAMAASAKPLATSMH